MDKCQIVILNFVVPVEFVSFLKFIICFGLLSLSKYDLFHFKHNFVFGILFLQEGPLNCKSFWLPQAGSALCTPWPCTELSWPVAASRGLECGHRVWVPHASLADITHPWRPPDSNSKKGKTFVTLPVKAQTFPPTVL